MKVARLGWLAAPAPLPSDMLSQGLGDGKGDSEQLCKFLEQVRVTKSQNSTYACAHRVRWCPTRQVALITTLLLSVVYPSYQDAASFCDTVDAHISGFGTLFLINSFCASILNLISAFLAVFLVMALHSTSSEAEAEYLISCAQTEIRICW